MSVIPLEDAKEYLNVIHSFDDQKLQGLLDGALREGLELMNRCSYVEFAPESSGGDSDYGKYGMPASVRTGVLFLLEASYQVNPDNAIKLREAGYRLLWQFRIKLGC